LFAAPVISSAGAEPSVDKGVPAKAKRSVKKRSVGEFSIHQRQPESKRKANVNYEPGKRLEIGWNV
jgi:hypothetical protein